eukprot:3715629-Rhodomonas_salina.3
MVHGVVASERGMRGRKLIQNREGARGAEQSTEQEMTEVTFTVLGHGSVPLVCQPQFQNHDSGSTPKNFGGGREDVVGDTAGAWQHTVDRSKRNRRCTLWNSGSGHRSGMHIAKQARCELVGLAFRFVTSRRKRACSGLGCRGSGLQVGLAIWQLETAAASTAVRYTGVASSDAPQ